jgi:hypothetical protein
MKSASTFVLVVTLFNLAASTMPSQALADAPIRPPSLNPFGMLLTIELWPWDLPLGWNNTVNLVDELGHGQFRLPITWGVSEPLPGQVHFDTTTDRQIADIEALGMRPMLSLLIGTGWMNSQPAQAGSRSYPPSDLSTIWHPEYGYSRSYYTFLKQFFAHYQGHFDYVAIENEANNPIFWGGTLEEYTRVLRTAYKAIKETDPNVQVMDSGMVSGGWGLCIARDWINSGLHSEDEAIDMVLQYYRRAALTGVFTITTPYEVRLWLAQPFIQQGCEELELALSRIGGSVDLLTFHFYEDFSTMHYVTEWLDRRLALAGYVRPKALNELGQRGYLNYATGVEYARDVFKSFTTALALDLDSIVWFSGDMTDQAIAEMFGDTGGWREAAYTYQLMLNTIGAQYRFDSAVASGPDLYHYIFQDTTNGRPMLEAAWAEGDAQIITFHAPYGVTSAVVTTYRNEQTTYPVLGGQLTLTIIEPVFIHWQ